MEQLLCFDHISLHLRDNNIEYMEKNEQIQQLQKQANKTTGFPFEPWNGKGSTSFQISNLWIGSQYVEFVQHAERAQRETFSDSDKSLHWKHKEWIERHFLDRKRGVFCLFISCSNVQSIYNNLLQSSFFNDPANRDVYFNPSFCKPTKHTIFESLFGWLKMQTPWKILYLKRSFPSHLNSLDIAFVEYDTKKLQQFRSFMEPNSEEFGIIGIQSIITEFLVKSDEADEIWLETKQYVTSLFDAILGSETCATAVHVEDKKQSMSVKLNTVQVWELKMKTADENFDDALKNTEQLEKELEKMDQTDNTKSKKSHARKLVVAPYDFTLQCKAMTLNERLIGNSVEIENFQVEAVPIYEETHKKFKQLQQKMEQLNQLEKPKTAENGAEQRSIWLSLFFYVFIPLVVAYFFYYQITV